ncbi:hypothetical protein SCLCIDRAFT_1215154 [Scleroderma citrinum Foug A]|uniref:Uncharacterized protein n=1 Tax=Scleroderma citrinum Foug A TaxID=1036808 RepID=A0A0C3E204_9AGAM|nr:hypothetical protein SCLCIDRAFT_1215154 [Scleroderma citrinum Foug A]
MVSLFSPSSTSFFNFPKPSRMPPKPVRHVSPRVYELSQGDGGIKDGVVYSIRSQDGSLGDMFGVVHAACHGYLSVLGLLSSLM